ncbi:MAG: hypothetical protein WBK51_03080 [Polaromonas sp.]
MLNVFKSGCPAGALLAALLLSGCAVIQVKPGTPRADVLAQYGQPSREVPLPNGSRLQYSYQPAGQQAVMVDLDVAGRVVSSRQVLQSTEFARIGINQWNRADVEREFGQSATIDRVASWPGDIMTYHWKDASQDMYFYVYLDSANIVQRTGQGMDFRKDPRRE